MRLCNLVFSRRLTINLALESKFISKSRLLRTTAIGMSVGSFEILLFLSLVMFLPSVSSRFDPEDEFLIDCGSYFDTKVGDREFSADESDSHILSVPRNIFVNTSSNSSPSTFYSSLHQTARIFDQTSNYTFQIKKPGWHWIRLHFFPFNAGTYNLSTAKFSVFAQKFTLLQNFEIEKGHVIKEFAMSITSENLVLNFSPLTDSFAFINALEVFSLPDGLIPNNPRVIQEQGSNQNLQNEALETVARVNMGNVTVLPQNDTLSRLWSSDSAYMISQNHGTFVSNLTAVNFTGGSVPEEIAPPSVYGTATTLSSRLDPEIYVNLTWNFDVDPGFDYFVRFHFCDIVFPSPGFLSFSVYVGSVLVDGNVDLSELTSHKVGVPYFMDVITRAGDNLKLKVSVGRSTVGNALPDAILNGLEIMKISNSEGYLDVSETYLNSEKSGVKDGLIVGLAGGVFVVVVVILAVVFFVICRRRRKSSPVGQEETEFAGNGVEKTQSSVEKAFFSDSKNGYRFPFADIQEATDNFSENLVIGTGGFGKVYKGILKDNTEVAVKRAASKSRQGLAEFRTEIEMLSQFRHRHLVSFIGFCEEHNEMIIIYEFMEKGCLKNHLYGSDLPSLSWRQRLEICIGSARGLHYLHTGHTKAIIHRDVKSANILLDENYKAKVADFGLSKIGPEINGTHVSTAVKGSFGYLDPEYLTRQKLTEKSDVYSFGVVMFEVLCGRPVIDPSLPREKINLIEWVMKCSASGRLEEISDPILANQIEKESSKKFLEIAEKCLAEQGINRPTMGNVLWNLEHALELQGNERSNREIERPSTVVRSWARRVSDTRFSVESSCDMDGISMSKVFAQMVQEKGDMR